MQLHLCGVCHHGACDCVYNVAVYVCSGYTEEMSADLEKFAKVKKYCWEEYGSKFDMVDGQSSREDAKRRGVRFPLERGAIEHADAARVLKSRVCCCSPVAAYVALIKYDDTVYICIWLSNIWYTFVYG
jgi:hypothetical protein